jgi:hypothetical protein
MTADLPPAEELQREPEKPTPGYRPLLWLSVGILTAFVGVTGWTLAHDATGAASAGLIQTWNNLVVGVGAFWFGSTVASKVQRLKGDR